MYSSKNLRFGLSGMQCAFKTCVLLLLGLLGAASAAVWPIGDFGAIGDGKTDCTAALQKAIEKARTEGPGVTIQFGKGRYLLSTPLPPDGKRNEPDFSHMNSKDREEFELYKKCRWYPLEPCILIKDVKGLTLAGLGSETELIVTVPLATAFHIERSTNIVFRDMVLDYDPIPFTQGAITAIDAVEGTFDLKIDDGYAELSDRWFALSDAKWGMPYDSQGYFRMGGESAVMTPTWESVGQRTWRMKMHAKGQAGGLAVGDRYVHLARMGGVASLYFHACGDLKVENVRFYSSPGTSVIAQECLGAIHVKGIQVMRRPGSDRLLSTNGDGVHCQSNRKGFLIEDCFLSGMADDGMNTYGLPSIITEVLAADTVRVRDVYVLQKGDRVQVFEPSTGVLRAASVEIASVESNVVTLQEPVAGIVAGANHATGDALFNLSACGSGFIVRNNVIGNFRGRGALARAHHGLIENNLIFLTSGQGISICNEPDWPEGPVPSDITIRGNTLMGVHRDHGQAGGAAIYLASVKKLSQPPQTITPCTFVADVPEFGNVTIENNTIIDPPASGIQLQGIRDAQLNGNTLFYAGIVRPIMDYFPVRLDRCRNVQISGLQVVDPMRITKDQILRNDTPETELK